MFILQPRIGRRGSKFGRRHGVSFQTTPTFLTATRFFWRCGAAPARSGGQESDRDPSGADAGQDCGDKHCGTTDRSCGAARSISIGRDSTGTRTVNRSITRHRPVRGTVPSSEVSVQGRSAHSEVLRDRLGIVPGGLHPLRRGDVLEVEDLPRPPELGPVGAGSLTLRRVRSFTSSRSYSAGNSRHQSSSAQQRWTSRSRRVRGHQIQKVSRHTLVRAGTGASASRTATAVSSRVRQIQGPSLFAGPWAGRHARRSC